MLRIVYRLVERFNFIDRFTVYVHVGNTCGLHRDTEKISVINIFISLIPSRQLSENYILLLLLHLNTIILSMKIDSKIKKSNLFYMQNAGCMKLKHLNTPRIGNNWIHFS